MIGTKQKHNIMRIAKLIPFAVLGLVALGACNRAELSPARRSLSVEAGIDEMTKVNTTGNVSSFVAGDKLSLYAWTGSASEIPATRVVDGAVNVLGTDGKWTSGTPMLWADLTSVHYFLGISPERSVTNFTADAYTLNPANYEGSDLLIATNVTGLKAENNPVSLVFTHAMARLDVNLSFRNQWAETPAVTAVAATAKKSGTVNYLTKAVSATGSAASVALTAASNEAWSGLQVPQNGVKQITITIDGKDYVFTHTDDIPLSGGKYTTVNLVLGRDQIELASPITISNWTSQGGAIDGDVFKPTE